MPNESGSSAAQILASRLLGPHARCTPLRRTKHFVSIWEANGQRIVTKTFTNTGLEHERRVYECAALNGSGLIPQMLGQHRDTMALEFRPGEMLVDVVDPAAWAQNFELLRRCVHTIARFHQLAEGLAPPIPDTLPIPGPRGFCHGDTLPHNLMLDVQRNPFLLDFEHGGRGPLMLDVIPVASIVPRAQAMQLLAEYYQQRAWPLQADDETAFCEILRVWPRLRLNRFTDEQKDRTFFDRSDIREKIIRWLNVAVHLHCMNG